MSLTWHPYKYTEVKSEATGTHITYNSSICSDGIVEVHMHSVISGVYSPTATDDFSSMQRPTEGIVYKSSRLYISPARVYSILVPRHEVPFSRGMVHTYYARTYTASKLYKC